jgi:hypothetical protein
LKPPYLLAATILLLLLFTAQAALGSPANSAAFDEEYHLAAGYAYLRTGDPRLSTEHPPLVNLWNALPLTFLNPNLPLDSPAWQNAVPDDFGDAFLWQANYDQAVRIVLLGRLPIIALGVLLGAVVFRFAREMFGSHAALLALALYAFDPNLIANSRLSTTDLGLTAMMTIAMWRLWAWLKNPTRWNLVWVGAAAGAAMTTKFTGLMLAPMFVLAALVYPINRHSERRLAAPRRFAADRGSEESFLRRIETLRRCAAQGDRLGILPRFQRLLALAVVGFIALLVIWAVYGFEIRNNLPAATYWRGLVKIYAEYSQGYPTFLMGQVSRTGWWYYFPVTFALKTPLPTLILLAFGSIVVAKQRSWQRASAVWLPPAFSMAAAMFSPLTIGYRHILPVLPFVIILAANAANLQFPILNFKFKSRLVRWRVSPCHLVIALFAWQALGAALIFPHHLSYFNELAGGPGNAHNILVDSNLDWGQDLPALKAWLDKRGIDRVNLSYFGTAIPEAYGVRYWPLPGFLHFVIGPEVDSFNPYTPEPGWYAISATSLRLGLVYREQDLFAYFRDKTPVARAGYSILIYQVDYPSNMPVDRAVVVGTPTYAVNPQTLGVTPGHRLIAKWIDNPDGFIFATNGPARYVAPDPLPFDRDLRRAFRSAAQKDGDALVMDARPLVETHLAEWRASLPSPAVFGGRLALIGYRLESPNVARGEALDLTTYWQVTGGLGPPIAFFAHVTDDRQNIIGQYDGWNTAVRGLEVGDVIVQHVRAPIQSDAQPGDYQLQLGVYSPDTMARWTLRLASGATADHIVLSSIAVR